MGGTALRGEVEKLQVERNMLLETIEDLRQTVEMAALLQPDTQVGSERASERERVKDEADVFGREALV